MSKTDHDPLPVTLLPTDVRCDWYNCDTPTHDEDGIPIFIHIRAHPWGHYEHWEIVR